MARHYAISIMSKQTSHDLVAFVRDLASKLQKTPTRAEFEFHVKGGKYKLEKSEFGSYQNLLDAAGIEPLTRGPKKINNDIFKKDIESHLEEYKTREEISPYLIKFKNPKIASISDIHWPFQSNKVIDAFIDFCKETQPDFIIINGDGWDMYSHSKYPKSVNIFTPREEEAKARKLNEEFWQDVKKVCPKAKCFQLLGNHDIRPLKRVIEEYPSAEDWIQEHFKKLFTFKGVETIYDYRQELIINDIAIFHGYRSKLGDHRDYIHMKCMIGHQHVGGTVFRRIKGQTIWECNSGVSGDIEAKGLAYSPQKMTHQTPGFSYVDKWGPRFIAV